LVERRETATERRARSALPVAAANDARFGLELVRTGDDDDLVESARGTEGGEDLREKRDLLRR
jgi:hypothetical protein